MSKITEAIARAEKSIADGLASGRITQAQLENVDKTSSIEFDEHFQYQELKSRAFASGIIAMDDAQDLYRFLGNSVETFNKQTPATKYVCLLFIQQMIKAMGLAPVGA